MLANVARRRAVSEIYVLQGGPTKFGLRAKERWLSTTASTSIAHRSDKGKDRESKRERFGGFDRRNDDKDAESPYVSRGEGREGRHRKPSLRSTKGFFQRQDDQQNAHNRFKKNEAPSKRPLKPTDWSRNPKLMLEMERGSFRNEARSSNVNMKRNSQRQSTLPQKIAPRSTPKPKNVKAQRVSIPLPQLITVSNLSKTLGVNMRRLQHVMSEAGHQDTRPDMMLTYSDAELLAMEFNIAATPSSSTSTEFDIFPRPIPADAQSLPLRPPVVAIMGHVDHGKTTLLDKLRSASVAAGEAGGITQHVGAFSVEVKGMSTSEDRKAITFLDTPGHAAFTQMRSRGAKITDIVVLVVAADDGVMPQTKEVINMVREVQEEEKGGAVGHSNGGLQLMIAITKIDRSDADPAKVKGQLMGENVLLEEFGGDVPCVEISGKTGEGLDTLQDTLVVVSELNELRAEREGPAEGYVIESRVQKGFGNTAIVLVNRGTIQVGDYCVAGTGWCKVRRLTDTSGQVAVDQAVPGEALMVTGWRELPNAGDHLLGVVEGADGQSAEDQVKRCIETRKRVEERRRLLHDVEAINEVRRGDAETRAHTEKIDREVRRLVREARLRGESFDRRAIEESVTDSMSNESESVESGAQDVRKEPQKKELRLIVKADVSGTAEAVIGAISAIGNQEVGVKIVSSGVGDPSEGDVDMARAVEGQILCFNVKASQALQSAAEKGSPAVRIHNDNVIYRLMAYVSEQCAALLPPILETRVVGEATVQQVFAINVRGKQTRNIAGCRVTNGQISRHQMVRVTRKESTSTSEDPTVKYDNAGRRILYEGRLESLKQVKKEVDEMRKGTECGMSFDDNFQDFVAGDLVQSYYIEKVPRTL